MNVLFFVSDVDWTIRARIFTAAAHGLAARGHEVSIACPPGAIIDRIDANAVDVVRIDPRANAALGTFDFRRVAQERSLDVVFVHSSREQLMVGSGLRLGKGGRVIRRLALFEARDDEAGLLTARMAPARFLVSTNAESAMMINAGSPPPFVAPLGIDTKAADVVAPLDRRALRLRDDDIVIACPYTPAGRPRLLNVMRSLALLAPRHLRVRAVIYGERAVDDELRMQAAALGVAPLVQFVDSANVDPVAVMKLCDFAWVVANHDAAAFGCLDAMAASRSIVAERSPTVELFVSDGINGTLLPDGDSSSLAAAVASVIGLAGARVAQGNAGRARVEREFGIERMIDGFERAVQGSDSLAVAR
jgi:glycosyltransferase involved in cell wall biosynthesis